MNYVGHEIYYEHLVLCQESPSYVDVNYILNNMKRLEVFKKHTIWI